MISSMKKDLNTIYKKVIAELWENEESIPFREPVDYKGLGLLDYPILIRTPMDLSTIKKKLKANKYRKNQDFIDDIQLIWENCKHYNLDTSNIYRSSLKMEKLAKRILKKYSIIKKISASGGLITKKIHKNALKTMVFYEEIPRISEEDKGKLSCFFKGSDQEKLFKVLNIINESMPLSIQENHEDNYTVRLSELNKETIEKITGIYQEKRLEEGGS